MVIQKLWVSQNFSGILRVSQCHFFKLCASHSLVFYTKVSWTLFFCKAKGLEEDFAFRNYIPPSSEQSKTNTDGTMESNTKSAFAANDLFETSNSVIQKG